MSAGALWILSIGGYALALTLGRPSFGFLEILPSILALLAARGAYGKLFCELLKLNIFLTLLALSLLLGGESLYGALHVWLRSNLILSFTLALFIHSDRFEVVRAIASLKIPKKMIALSFFAARFIESLLIEVTRGRERMRARGVSTARGRVLYEAYGYWIGSLALKALNEAEQLLLTLSARGYTGEILLLDPPRAKAWSWVIFFTTLGVLVYRGANL